MDSAEFDRLMEVAFFSKHIADLALMKASGQIVDYKVTGMVPGSHINVDITPRAVVDFIYVDIDVKKTKEQDQ
jgi:hypothetical protein